jgi:putative hydrolase of the HAD superfamily
LIEVVFLDAGETILHPHPSFHELFAQVCAENGVTVDPTKVRAVQEKLAPHLVDLAEETGVREPSLSPEGSRRFWTHLYRRFLEELDLPVHPLSDLLYARFTTSSTYKLFDDALPAIRDLQHAGYRLGLISNFERWLEETLVELEIGHLFDISVISGIVGVEKPDPAIYRIALDKAAVDASRAVHIGDSVALDVEPARRVGLNTVLLDRARRYLDFTGPRIESLEELAGVVSNL